ncbi:hypothetical protein [Mycoplasma sp. P36-A1]|uniref:hypothetical protein n=1 Tax=Mycoplasma sp. P36-A1 TaxID=3252900 RepID=UPI003C2C77C3
MTNKLKGITINDWTEDNARDFLIKGGVVTTVVKNFNSEDELTHYCITEKQVPPHYKLHLNKKEKIPENKLEKLRKQLK